MRTGVRCVNAWHGTNVAIGFPQTLHSVCLYAHVITVTRGIHVTYLRRSSPVTHTSRRRMHNNACAASAWRLHDARLSIESEWNYTRTLEV